MDLNKIFIEELISKIRQTDDFHNRCDCLLEHDETTRLIEYLDTILDERENLIHIVANKIIDNYDIESPLKEELNKARLTIIEKEEIITKYIRALKILNKTIEEWKMDRYSDFTERARIEMNVLGELELEIERRLNEEEIN